MPIKTEKNAVRRVDFERATGADVARLFGITRSAVSQWPCPRRPDGSYSLPAVVAWKMGNLAADADLGSGDSPELERYRRARAGLAELDLQERLKSLVSRSQVRECIVAFAQQIRNVGEHLTRRFGNDAADMLIRGVDDGYRAIKGILGESETAPGPGAKTKESTNG